MLEVLRKKYAITKRDTSNNRKLNMEDKRNGPRKQ